MSSVSLASVHCERRDTHTVVYEVLPLNLDCIYVGANLEDAVRDRRTEWGGEARSIADVLIKPDELVYSWNDAARISLRVRTHLFFRGGLIGFQTAEKEIIEGSAGVIDCDSADFGLMTLLTERQCSKYTEFYDALEAAGWIRHATPQEYKRMTKLVGTHVAQASYDLRQAVVEAYLEEEREIDRGVLAAFYRRCAGKFRDAVGISRVTESYAPQKTKPRQARHLTLV